MGVVGGTTARGIRHRVAAYAALVRVPNLFTAPPDVLLGAALVVAAGAAVDSRALAGLAVASVLLYAGGTTLNDAFDAPIDAEERPDRPIPSGRVARSTAFGLGVAFIAVGVGLAGTTGVDAGAIAAAIAVSIVLYDGALSGGPAGPLAMGAIRGTNVVLGTTAGVASTAPPARAYAVPIVVGTYVAAVTVMANRETLGGDRRSVAVAAGGVLLAAASVGWYVGSSRPTVAGGVLVLALGTAFLAWTGRALWRAYADPVPGTVGPAVGTCVLALTVLDAGFAVAGGVRWALATVSLLVPALAFSRTFDVS